MSNSQVPFYSQTAVLDRYVHASNPSVDGEAVEVIVRMLNSREDLRTYFFRSRPSAAWARILWDRGFFSHPPSPEKTEQGYILPRWDVQDYLISVAAQAPDVVLEHVESIIGYGWYISQAIRALSCIPSDQAERAVPRIVSWLNDPEMIRDAAPQAYELLIKFVQEARPTAFQLFDALAAPIIPSKLSAQPTTLGTEAISKFDTLFDGKQAKPDVIALLARQDIQTLITILEGNLRSAIQLEAGERNLAEYLSTSWWRSAVEETTQDSNDTYKERVLVSLRDTVERLVELDVVAARALIEKYLRDPNMILRRLGLHLLQRYPEKFSNLVRRELRQAGNIDDVRVHHEFFMLMRQGYPFLGPSEREALIVEIKKGPPDERMQKLAEWAQKERGLDPEGYSNQYSKWWILNRLWMIKEYLSGASALFLKGLIAELGTPEHPEFTAWTTGAFWVRDISPISERELSQMTPDQLLRFITEWTPASAQRIGPEQITYNGLAGALANLVAANPSEYSSQLSYIVLQRPEFADAVLRRFAEDEKIGVVPWALCLELCDNLLGNEVIRNQINYQADTNWISVRNSIVRLLHGGLVNPQRGLPHELLPRIRDLLLILINDPDPTVESDSPPKGYAGHNDPATVAVNHVRPNALAALIVYAQLTAEDGENIQSSLQGGAQQQTGGLEPIVRNALTRKLDTEIEHSKAVHSVYGHFLPTLYWLDRQWAETHLDQIFPEGDDDDTISLFVAAWDSYVIFNRFNAHLASILQTKYQQALSNVSMGRITQTHLQPIQHFAIHVVWEYLVSDFDVRSPTAAQSLVVRFFQELSPAARGEAAWVCWRICADNDANVNKYWGKIRAILEWRIQEASLANHSSDFDNEIGTFAYLLPSLPATETILTLWPVLEGLLPHITRAEYQSGSWDAVEKYLVKEVESEPTKVIQFYRLMYEQLPRPRGYFHSNEARQIIEAAAAQRLSRNTTLALIDLLGRNGNYRYQDIYDRYAK